MDRWPFFDPNELLPFLEHEERLVTMAANPAISQFLENDSSRLAFFIDVRTTAPILLSTRSNMTVTTCITTSTGIPAGRFHYDTFGPGITKIWYGIIQAGGPFTYAVHIVRWRSGIFKGSGDPIKDKSEALAAAQTVLANAGLYKGIILEDNNTN